MKRVLFLLYVVVLLFTPANTSASSIDIETNSSMESHDIKPSPICSDEIFLRRTYLIVAGRLPSITESRAFLDSKDNNRRENLIDKLLSSDDYVDMLCLKWGDLLKIKAEFPSNIWPNGAQAYNRWVRVHMRENTPYDRFVSDLLLASGSNFRQPQVSFYRAFVQRKPELIAENIELLFLGRREPQPQTAQFFEQLKFKATSEWKEEIVYVDLDINPKMKHVTMPLDGRDIILEIHTDLREDYVEWLTSENMQFARAMANRVWYWIMGRGVVHEPDDFRDDNEPSNVALLEYLTTSFIESGYDVKALFREILLSQTYQRSSLPTPENEEFGAEYFAYYPTSRLTAEQLIDGISLITDINDRYVSRVPEPYSYYPADLLSSTIGDASVSSAQLDLFGRPSRDNSLENQRNNDINSKQTLYLLNSNSITEKIESSKKIKLMVSQSKSFSEMIDTIYIMMLSRYPTSNEKSTLTPMLKEYDSKQKAAETLIWALLNSSEFMFNH